MNDIKSMVVKVKNSGHASLFRFPNVIGREGDGWIVQAGNGEVVRIHDDEIGSIHINYEDNSNVIDSVYGDSLLDRYHQFVEQFWFGDGDKTLRDMYIMTAGLAGETGEVMEILKKFVRDDALDTQNLVKELGDVLYYWMRICIEFDITPDQVINTNIHKLTDRAKRDKMRGSGDDR